MMFGLGAAIEPRTHATLKGFSPVKKHLALLAVLLAITAAPVHSLAQSTLGSKPAFIVDAPAERIPNLDKLKEQVKQYHDCTCTCGCYAHDLDLQADRAIAFLRRRALHIGPHEKLALVLDIDETTLSNYQEMLRADFAYNVAAFDAWVNTAQAPAIPGTLRLYRESQRLGVSVFFITGRPEPQQAATERDLRAQGFQDWQQLTLRQPSEASEMAEVYKSHARAQIAAQGYKIVLNVGDQWSDLKGKPEAELSVKYPDPFYFLK
jgi:acid phosphatase